MNPFLRFLPAAIVVLMLTIKIWFPDFLASVVFDLGLFTVSWFWLIFLPLLYLAAFALNPIVVKVVTTLGARGLLLPTFFIALALGALAVLDIAYGLFIGSWCDCGEPRFVDSVVNVFKGE